MSILNAICGPKHSFGPLSIRHPYQGGIVTLFGFARSFLLVVELSGFGERPHASGLV